jgi:hypothetical protein
MATIKAQLCTALHIPKNTGWKRIVELVTSLATDYQQRMQYAKAKIEDLHRKQAEEEEMRASSPWW